MPLTIAIGRTGQPWEATLLASGEKVVQGRTLVDLLVVAELHSPDVIVVAQDFPRLSEGLGQLRRLGEVVVVGDSRWADCPAHDVSVEFLRERVAPVPGSEGHLVTVWGPQGSWGVTSVSIGLARSLARREETLLIDANVHAPTIGDELSQPLGGLLQACLAADRGAVDLPVRTTGRLSVLTGVEPRMYPAVHPAALEHVVEAARRSWRWVVADTDPAIDDAGDMGLVPDWTSATTVCLQQAEHVVVVIGESETSLQRLWRSLPVLATVATGRTTVVVNRCRNPRVTTARLAERLGDYLPEAAVGWIRDGITDKSLAPIVAEVARQPSR